MMTHASSSEAHNSAATSTSARNGQRSPRRRRRSLKVGLLMLIVIGLAIGALPWILSMGPGKAYVLNMLAQQVDGTISIDRMTMRWGGPHHVESIAIHDHAGRLVGQVDAWLHGSLWSVLTGLDQYDLRVRGELHSYVEDDGTVQWVPLRDVQPDADEPFRIAIPAMPLRLALEDVAWTLHQGDVDALVLRELTGEIDLLDAAALRANVQAVAVRDDVQGEVRFVANANDLFSSIDRVMSPQEADLNIELELTSLPLVLDGHRHDFQDLLVQIVASNVAEAVLLSANGQRVEGSLAESLDAGAVEIAARWDTPIRDDESLRLDPALWSGSLTLHDMPTVAAMPMLAQMTDVRAEEIGPLFSVEGAFGAGEDRAFHMHWESEALRARVQGAADQNAGQFIVNDSWVEMHVQPQRIAQWTGWQASGPVPVMVSVRSGSVAPPGWATLVQPNNAPANGQEEPWWRTLIADADIDIADMHTLIAPNGTGAVDIGQTRLGVRLALSDDGLLEMNGSAAINEGHLRVEQHITGYLNEGGVFDLARAQPIGSIELHNIETRLLDLFIDIGDLPALAAHRLGMPADMGVTTQLSTGAGADIDQMLKANAWYIAEDMAAEAVVTRTDDATAFVLDETVVNARLTHADVQTLFAESPPFILNDPAWFRLTLNPLVIRYAAEVGIGWPAQLAGSISSGDALNFARDDASEPIRVHALDAVWHHDFDQRTTHIDCSGIVADASGDMLTQLTGLLTMTGNALGETTADDRPFGRVTWELAGNDLDTGRVAAMLGAEAMVWQQWLGEHGRVHLQGTGEISHQIDAVVDFPRFAGTFAVALDDDHVSLSGASSRWTVARERAQQLLIPRDVSLASYQASYHVSRDVPMQMTINDITLPFSLLRDGSLDALRSAIDVQVQGGPIRVREALASGAVADPSVQPLAIFDDIELTLLSTDLRLGMTVDFGADVSGQFLETVPTTLTDEDDAVEEEATENDAQQERIAFRGMLTGLTGGDNAGAADIDEDDADVASGMLLTGTLTGGALPTAIFDAHGAFDGLLVAAVGPSLRPTISANEFSPHAGRIDGRIEMPQGYIAGGLLGLGHALIIDAELPIAAELELTRAFRDRVLRPIHPLFADIRSTEHPVQAQVTEGRIPLGGDISAIDVAMRIEVGAVEFTSGSLLLGVLRLFDTDRGIVPGYIEPVQVRIKDGIVTYDRFVVRVDRHTIAYQGEIDLNTRTMNMRTELPGESLARTFRELTGFIEELVIPFRIIGPIDEPKIEIDPSFDFAAAAIEAGIRGVITREIPELIKPINDVLDRVFGRPRRDER